MSLSETVLEYRDVTVDYGDEPILRSVSLSFGAAEFVGLVGPNGSGKSTLLKAAVGLLPLRSGEVRLFGQPLARFAAWQRVGYVPQHVQAVGSGFPASVAEVVAMGRFPRLGLAGRPGKVDRDAIEHAMEVTGVAPLRKRLLGELSGGQRQRVFVARALAGDPEILLLDEPAAAIDPEGRAQFTEIFADLHRHHRITVLYVSHDLSSLRQQLTRVVLINRAVLFDGTPAELEARPEFAYFLEEAHHFHHVVEAGA